MLSPSTFQLRDNFAPRDGGQSPSPMTWAFYAVLERFPLRQVVPHSPEKESRSETGGFVLRIWSSFSFYGVRRLRIEATQRRAEKWMSKEEGASSMVR
jgi:hypothetical protein